MTKAEEKMRVLHERKCRKLKRLDERGAEADKVESSSSWRETTRILTPPPWESVRLSFGEESSRAKDWKLQCPGFSFHEDQSKLLGFVTIANRGVLLNIHQTLLPKKVGKGKSEIGSTSQEF